MAVALTGLPDDEADDDGDVVVLPGDTPLLRPATLAALVQHHRASDAAATLLTARSTTRPATAGWCAGGTTPWPGWSSTEDATDEELEVARGQHLDLLLPTRACWPRPCGG